MSSQTIRVVSGIVTERDPPLTMIGRPWTAEVAVFLPSAERANGRTVIPRKLIVASLKLGMVISVVNRESSRFVLSPSNRLDCKTNKNKRIRRTEKN